jgi:Ca-activated chloride channel family protein
MTWVHPLALLLLLVPAAGALASGRGTLRRAWPGLARVAVAGARVRPAAAGPGGRAWRLWAALALAVMALAGPRWGETGERTEEPAREVIIALDLSRSMLVRDVAPTRIDRAHAIVRGLLDGLGGDRAGLVVFSGGAYVQVPLSSDDQILRDFLPVLRPGYLPPGGSDYAAMLRAAGEGFSEDPGMDRYLIVVGDGESTTDGWPAELVRLRQRGIRVVALGVGTTAGGDVPPRRSGEPSPAHSRLEPRTLQQMAAATEGLYRNASEPLDLRALLAETVELSRRTRWAEHPADHAADRYRWFLVPALALGLLGLWSEIAARPRTRAIRRTAAGFGAEAAIAAFAVAGLVLALAAVAAVAHDIGDEADVPITALGKLRKLVNHVSGHTAIEAPDLLRIAELTVNYGIETLDRGEAVEDGAILDGLEAVRHGQQLAPTLPEWEHLRIDLERLRLRRAQAEAARRPPEEKKESYDEEDKPVLTNGQGTQQTTSESSGEGGVALSDIAIGQLGKAPPRPPGATPAPKRPRPNANTADAAGGAQAAPSPLRKLLLKHYREVSQGDQPGLLFQTLNGGPHPEASGGKDW